MRSGSTTTGLVYPIAPVKNFYLTFSILLLIFLSPHFSYSQTPLSFTQIPYSETDIIAPGRGVEQWNNGSEAIAYPAEYNTLPAADVYYRITWNRLEGSAQGSYNWSYFDGIMREAINKGQKLSLGIISCYPDGQNSPGVVSYDNGDAAYPEYLHHMMQSEAYPDWKTNGYGPTDGYGSWVPNWNSPFYLSRLRALHEALYSHILSTSYNAQAGPHKGKTIAFKNVLSSVDIRGYGSWGEWHSSGITEVMSLYPEGRRPTASTLKTIIDHHVGVFTDHPLSVMISAFDGERLPNTDNPKEVGAYALTISNNWGKLGWRRDSWGSVDEYLDWYLKENTASYGASGPFNTLIMSRWKYAPITGEPLGWLASYNGACSYNELENQVREYHVTSVGNGNYGTYNLADCSKENIRAGFKAAGYRIILTGGSVSSSVNAGGNLGITLNWRNTGVAPSYDKWDVVFELKNNEDSLVWSGQSQFSPGYRKDSMSLLPSTVATVIKDNFTLPAGIPAGNYNLRMAVKDPVGYRQPLPLAIYGGNEDGSYTLQTITISAGDGVVSNPVDTTTTDCSVTAASIDYQYNCSTASLDLRLASANGTGPFDVVVDGVTYPNVPAGGTILKITDEKIWSANPSTVTHEDNPVELGVRFTSSTAGVIKGIRFFSGSRVAGAYTGHLWDADGNLLASADFSNVTANGWQQVLFSVPVAINPGAVYVASYHTSAGLYVASSGGLGSAVFNSRSLTALGNSTEGGVYTYNAPGFPSNTFQGNNYWVDVVFSTSPSAFNLESITDNTGCTANLQQTITVVPVACPTEEAIVSARSAATSNQSVMAGTGANSLSPETILANELSQNYPNPSVSETIIFYSLAKTATVNIALFDLNGRLVKLLVNSKKEAGKHVLHVNTGSLAGGVYLYKLQTGDYSAVKRMIVR